jgi:hypothetical protein
MEDEREFGPDELGFSPRQRWLELREGDPILIRVT